VNPRETVGAMDKPFRPQSQPLSIWGPSHAWLARIEPRIRAFYANQPHRNAALVHLKAFAVHGRDPPKPPPPPGAHIPRLGESPGSAHSVPDPPKTRSFLPICPLDRGFHPPRVSATGCWSPIFQAGPALRLHNVERWGWDKLPCPDEFFSPRLISHIVRGGRRTSAMSPRNSTKQFLEWLDKQVGKPVLVTSARMAESLRS